MWIINSKFLAFSKIRGLANYLIASIRRINRRIGIASFVRAMMIYCIAIKIFSAQNLPFSRQCSNIRPTKIKKKFEYPFPKLGTPAMKALLAYLYIRQVPSIDLPLDIIFEIADAAEQYGLTTLKKLCAAVLWERKIDG